ncbi:MAG: 2-hydroxyhepta-2,4-diene-1,7-dioate isomerase [Bacteroidetes bacterium]|nr:MAG: 2-hydroxyhepta-2,4-diene-1,7-dioate isomerase [Bacteroidota bacterium]
MKLFKTSKGILLQKEKEVFRLQEEWDHIINRQKLFEYLGSLAKKSERIDDTSFDMLINTQLAAPIGRQELWAAGVTYIRSRDARKEESKSAGGADFYDKVYEAERPELFFKSLAHRVAAHNSEVYIRKDSSWNVPEPELTLFINSTGDIQGYTVGNDMSSRSIEGENPLYLPQAKVYERSAALGPCLFVPPHPIFPETLISIIIRRQGRVMFDDSIRLSRMKRSLTDLAAYLFRECEFNHGCFLMTGTGMVPSNDFTLQLKDEIDITIEGIGTLRNTVAMNPIHKTS